MKAKITSNIIYKHLLDSDKKIIIEQGGTRSGKTYNILLWIITYYANKNKGKTITICRKTFPALRGTVLRDFITILKKHNIYNVDMHNKSSSEFHLYGNLIEFISLDQAQKVRGRKRDLLFINEANELNYDDWQQLIFRTTEKIIIDYNPSDEFHWIYDKVITRNDADFFQTNYLDNPYLEDSIRHEIERLKDLDENYWRVYGLGEIGQSKDNIFNKFHYTDKVPDNASLVSYGLDFGYSIDPTVLISVHKQDDNIYLDEHLHETNLTNQDIANRIKDIVGKDEIICDSAEPKSIEELYRMGLNVKGAVKGADSIRNGIDILKRFKIHLTNNSINLIKEFKNYKWAVDRNGIRTGKPVDKFNHCIDAVRYSALIHLKENKRGYYSIR